MLEAVHGVGALLKQGWRPKRTIVFCSWDAEEEGLIGSTEWVEQHAKTLEHAVAYFNIDVAVAGPDFSASAVPSLKQFVRELTRSVPSPLGGNRLSAVEDRAASEGNEHRGSNAPPRRAKMCTSATSAPAPTSRPSSSTSACPPPTSAPSGPYGVYHSAFDNYAWFTQNADPHFVYLQEMARVFGLEALRMADADVLPYDYVTYAHEIESLYRSRANAKRQTPASARSTLPPPRLPPAACLAAAQGSARPCKSRPPATWPSLNQALRQTETALISEPACPTAPGTGTPSTPPASSPATRPW